MYCPNCGARNDRTATSCVNCGVALQPTDAPSGGASETSASQGETSGVPPTPPGSSTPPQDASSQPTILQPGSSQSGSYQPSTPPPDPPAQPTEQQAPTTPTSGEQRGFAPSSGSMGSSGTSGGMGSMGGGSYAGSSSGGAQQQVPNRLVAAIIYTAISLILAFFSFGFTGLGVITGIIAIVFAAQVNGKVASGDYQGAQQASKTARILNLVTLGIIIVGVIIAIIVIAFIVFAMMSGSGA